MLVKRKTRLQCFLRGAVWAILAGDPLSRCCSRLLNLLAEAKATARKYQSGSNPADRQKQQSQRASSDGRPHVSPGRGTSIRGRQFFEPGARASMIFAGSVAETLQRHDCF